MKNLHLLIMVMFVFFIQGCANKVSLNVGIFALSGLAKHGLNRLMPTLKLSFKG